MRRRLHVQAIPGDTLHFDAFDSQDNLFIRRSPQTIRSRRGGRTNVLRDFCQRQRLLRIRPRELYSFGRLTIEQGSQDNIFCKAKKQRVQPRGRSVSAAWQIAEGK
jgi:hypothetical protein